MPATASSPAFFTRCRDLVSLSFLLFAALKTESSSIRKLFNSQSGSHCDKIFNWTYKVCRNVVKFYFSECLA